MGIDETILRTKLLRPITEPTPHPLSLEGADMAGDSVITVIGNPDC